MSKNETDFLQRIDMQTSEGQKKLDAIFSRSRLDYGSAQETVDRIVSDVRQNGDKALFSYTKEFDHVCIKPHTVKVTQKEIQEAYETTDSELVNVIRRAVVRITDFHQKQKQNSWLEPSSNGEMLGQLIRPLEKVGVYVPGGTAAYPSSVLMNIIPASVAGVSDIIMVSPAGRDGKINASVLVAANEAGVSQIFKIGGAQAVAALAFGTETIPKVDKVTGPGNIYVALAKRSVYGYVGIDSVAGPSEILIIADHTANPVYVAADLLSQAEHDPLACSILITTDKKLADRAIIELKRQANMLERKDIIEKSLNDYGTVICVGSLEEAVSISNQIAPEHLEICTAHPFDLLPLIKNAGAIFLGPYTPEPLGDYMAGPNHVLPTGGTARFFSPLSVDDFVKKSSLLSFSKSAFDALAQDVICFAEAEGLTAHANAVSVRIPPAKSGKSHSGGDPIYHSIH